MKLSAIVRVVVTALIFYLLFYFTGIDIKVLISDIREADLTNIIFSFLALNISIFVSGLRWRYLLTVLGFDIGRLLTIKEYYKAHFYNNFLPTSVGGDISRTYNVGKKIGSTEDVVTTVVIERGLGLISLVAIACVGMLFLELDSRLQILTYITLPIMIIALLLPVIPKTNSILRKLVSILPQMIEVRAKKILDIFLTFHKKPTALLVATGYSVIFRVVESLFIYFIVRSLGVDFSFQYVLVLHSIVSVIKFIPVTINGLGISESAWVALTLNSGIDSERAALISLLGFSVSFLNSLIGGGISLFEKFRK